MKALRYLLIAVVMLMANICAHAQFTQVNSLKGCTTFGQEERQYQFHSTSAMLHPGSNADADGGVFTTSVSTGQPMFMKASGKRRGLGDGDDDIPQPDDNNDPDETPIGDGMWALLLLAAGYVIYRVHAMRARKEA